MFEDIFMVMVCFLGSWQSSHGYCVWSSVESFGDRKHAWHFAVLHAHNWPPCSFCKFTRVLTVLVCFHKGYYKVNYDKTSMKFNKIHLMSYLWSPMLYKAMVPIIYKGKLSNWQQFSMVCTLIDHINKVKMSKTQVELRSAGECFCCKVLMSIVRSIRV